MCHAMMRLDGDVVSRLDELARGKTSGISLDDLLSEVLWRVALCRSKSPYSRYWA